ncbi:RNA-directed DNA polymerase [Candidatus Sulfidibacterium hydrothermale]|uniref:RNA-directed DNA polymerase n=1 Tax=Candidatus Sulfidibacterium hydrothermale TaxID=2875962 RepID=UPI001F0A6A90|nr:RNA-directed DNA polymerase [Candidatus Sulfidibacterium hydrothermale]UBM61361.1 RNA-directed DNA polymerase [Candidatus Sulfidibacterium hydrothermale]
MSLIEKHFRKTEKLIKLINEDLIANWLLNEGYYPEQYVVPPSFRVKDFELQENVYINNLANPPRRKLINISYPKSLLTSRIFGIQHPHNYHDIVYWLMDDWDNIINHIFHEDLKIFSYSFPIPVNDGARGELSPLRSGRMIYEWITMAEKDLVAEAHKYNLIVRSDITNFYNSIYTHSIGWALHGQETAFKDKTCTLTGNKIDKLVQYANNGRTNGIPVGSAVSDLIAEIILSSIDLKISQKLKDKDFIATRFKDDYRILCNTESDAKEILKVLAEELTQFNLLINESKTKILELPNGLYRQHDRAYQQYSIKDKERISFKTFELTLLTVLDIHKEYPGTSILEKFFSELFNNDYDLKIQFSTKESLRRKEILKTLSLLVLVKRESEKILCHILSVIEFIYLKYRTEFKLKEIIKELVKSEIIKANDKQSIFELSWYLFFARYIGLGISEKWINSRVNKDLRKNPFLKSACTSKQQIYNDSHINLFSKPKDCRGTTLAKKIAVFERNKDE